MKAKTRVSISVSRTIPLCPNNTFSYFSNFFYAFLEFGSTIRLAEKEVSSDFQLLIERVV